jgi:hypothetical protein
MSQTQKHQMTWYTRPSVMLQSFGFFSDNDSNDTKSAPSPLSTWESDGGSNFSQHPTKTKIAGGERLDELPERKKMGPVEKARFAYHLIKGEVLKKLHPEK